jgi:PAT family beta-lactamase induction signal transducer AmpG
LSRFARPPPFLPPPFWALLTLPFGLTVGFASIAVPFVLRAHDVPMTLIATVTQVAQFPHVIKLLWTPALDSGPKRRSWFFASIAVTALSLAALAFIPPSVSERVGPVALIWVYTAVLFTAQTAVATSSSAVLALMAMTMPDARRGAASGWQSAGNLVGTSMGGGLVTWMIRHLSPTAAAIILAGTCCAASLPALFIDEVPPPRRNLVGLVVDLLKEIIRTLRSREGWTAMVICLSPVGAGALTNLFSALARDYAPSDPSAEHLVIVVTGLFGAAVSAVGSLAGGYLADRMNRRLSYVVFGGATALCAVGMMLAPPSPTAFTIGCLAYQFTNGLAYAAFYAFVLELLGKREGVTTQLALYVGASNFAITYVTWFDGWGYDRMRTLLPANEWAGRAGMLGMDALATFIGIAMLTAMMIYVRRGRTEASPAA